MFKKRKAKILLYTLLVVFILANILAFNHARSFTRYIAGPAALVELEEATWWDKVTYGFTGVASPRPVNYRRPEWPHKTVYVKSNETLECWHTQVRGAKATILMLHGYKAAKSQMLERAAVFNAAGYSTMLVDMMGSGGSTGNTVTIGYREALNVRDCYQYLVDSGERNIVIYGVSMGAAAAMKAIKDYELKPAALVTEAPFARMYDAVGSRFDALHLPRFPLAQMLMFWGGTRHGFWAFGHNPEDYAKHIKCPTLIVHGAQDNRVSMNEIEAIHKNLSAQSKVVVYPKAGHVNYLYAYKQQWSKDVLDFTATALAGR